MILEDIRYNGAKYLFFREETMKTRLTSAVLILLLLMSLFSGCSGMPEAGNARYDTTPAAAAETTVPDADGAAIVEEAYGLKSMESLSGCYTLTGTVTQIITRYSTKFENITVEMAVAGCEDRPIQCFRLEGDGAEALRVGDIITVAGQLMNYKGIIEFDAGCVLLSVVPSEHPVQEESTAIFEESDDSAEAVAAYIHANGCLPDFYMTKNEARDLFGWEGGALDNLAPGRAIGGDRFHNYEDQLPDAAGRYYTECDIDTIGNGARGARRIVFSNDGLIFYTEDHYDTFTLLYGEP